MNIDDYIRDFDNIVITRPWGRLDHRIIVTPEADGSVWITCERDMMRAHAKFEVIQFQERWHEIVVSAVIKTWIAGIQVSREWDSSMSIGYGNEAMNRYVLEERFDKFQRRVVLDFCAEYGNMYKMEIDSAVKRKKLEDIAFSGREDKATFEPETRRM